MSVRASDSSPCHLNRLYSTFRITTWEGAMLEGRRGVAILFFGLVAAGLAGAPGKASAWGSDGHMIVALIAQQYLDPDVKKKVDALLKSDKDKLTAKDIASRAVWADKYRDSDRNGKKIRYNGTQNW